MPEAKRQACVFPAAAMLHLLPMKRRPRGLELAHTDSLPPSAQDPLNRNHPTQQPDISIVISVTHVNTVADLLRNADGIPTMQNDKRNSVVSGTLVLSLYVLY